MRFLFLLLALAGGAAAAAEGSDFAAPLLGYVHDPAAAAVHPLSGVPGAALLRARMEFGFPVERLAASPRYRALLVVDGDAAVHLARVAEGDRFELSRVGVGNALAWSPSGQSAIIYGHRQGNVRILPRLLGGNAASEAVTDLSTGPLCEGATTMAVSDDGQAWLALCEDGRLLRPDPVALPEAAAAVQFERGSREALAVTRAGDLWRIGADGQARLERAGAVPFGNVISIRAAGAAGDWLLLARDGRLAMLNLAEPAAAVAVYECHCTAATLDPLDSDTLFAVNRILEDEPLRLFDAARRRFWFVPRYSAPAAEPEAVP